MEQNVNVWKANLANGVVLGMISVIFTLILYFLDLTTNRGITYLMIPVNMLILYFMIRSYRENYCHGILTFGQSMGAGMIIILYSIIISVLFSYIFFKYIDPGLIAKILADSEEVLVQRGMSQDQIDAAMVFTKKLMTPGFMTITSFFSGMFFGAISILIVSIFTRKEGNPLIDTPETE